jgi:hypothetical protein
LSIRRTTNTQTRTETETETETERERERETEEKTSSLDILRLTQILTFDETQLDDLPRNLILSQEWRINARPNPALPTTKRPVTYRTNPLSTMATASQQDKARSMASESSDHDASVDATGSQSIAALVDAFNKSSTNGQDHARVSRTSSISSTQPVVSNLVRIYSEVVDPQQQKSRTTSVVSSNKHEELTQIFERASNRSTRASSIATLVPQTQDAADESVTHTAITHRYVPFC